MQTFNSKRYAETNLFCLLSWWYLISFHNVLCPIAKTHSKSQYTYNNTIIIIIKKRTTTTTATQKKHRYFIEWLGLKIKMKQCFALRAELSWAGCVWFYNQQQTIQYINFNIMSMIWQFVCNIFFHLYWPLEQKKLPIFIVQCEESIV